MPIFTKVGNSFKEVVTGAVNVNGTNRALKQVFVNINGTFRPVWKFNSFRVGSFQFRIDDSAYCTVNFSTGVVSLFLNRDRRSYSQTSYLGPENKVWEPGIRGTGSSSSDWNAYVSASIYVPSLKLSMYQLYQIKRCTVGLIGGARNNPYMTQQPNVSNGFVARWDIRDPQPGPAGYNVGMWVE